MRGDEGGEGEVRGDSFRHGSGQSPEERVRSEGVVRVVFRMRNTHAPPGTRTTTNTKTYLDVFLFRYDLQEVFRAREAPPRESVQATGNFVAFRISRGFAKPDHPRAPPSVLRLNLHQPAHHRVRRVVVLGRMHRAAKIPPARKRTRVTGRLAMHSNCGVPEAYRDSYSYCSALQEMQRKDELSFATMVNPRHNRARRRSPAPSAPEMVDEEIAFDPDIHKSHLGRLVKVRESTNHTWQHGVPCFAVTEWELEDYHGDGKMCKVEKPTGGYQLQWGLFERIEQAMSQKRSAKTVRVAFCVVRFRARPPAGRLDAAP